MGGSNNTTNNDKYTINFKDKEDFSVDITKEIFDKIKGHKDRKSNVNKLKGIGISILQDENKNDIDITGFFDSSKRVPNVERYILKKRKCGCYYEIDEVIKRKKEFEKSHYCDTKPNNDKTSKSIVIILESPHKYEYNDDFEPIAPAQKTTGKMIKEYLDTLIYYLMSKGMVDLKDEEYRVIICNPVPYQTSLYHIHNIALGNRECGEEIKKIRDDVWNRLFDDERQKDFINNINSYNPILFINACTEKYRERVTRVIKTNETLKDITTVETNHPSSLKIKIEVKK